MFDQVLFLDINFHKLKLTRGSSYLSLLDWISSKKVVINPKNEESKHFEYCVDHKVVRTDMPKENSFTRFHSGQYQFKVPFIIYADFSRVWKRSLILILEAPTPEVSTTILSPDSVVILCSCMERSRIH